MEEKDNIEDQLQNMFDDFEMSADDRVWENIETELTKSNKRPAAYWWKMGLAASVAGGISILATQFFFDPIATNQNEVAQHEPSKENIIVPIEEREEVEIKEEVEKVVDQTVAMVEDNRPVVKSSSSFSVSHSPKETVVSNHYEVAESASATTTTNRTIAPTPTDPLTSESESEVAVVEPMEEEEETEEVSESVAINPIPLEDPSIEPLIPEKDESEWMLAANYGTMPPENDGSDISTTYFGDQIGIKTESGQSPSSLNNPSIFAFSFDSDPYDPIEYGMPFITGVSVSKATSKRGALESGVQLIRVASKNSSYRYSFYYLGLPVNYRHKVIDKSKFDLYTSGGITFEIGLKSTVKSIDGKEPSYNSMNPGFHTSLNLGIGNEFTLSKRTSLFVQPGMSLTFLNRLWDYYPIGDIRSIKRLWPSLNTGLRFIID